MQQVDPKYHFQRDRWTTSFAGRLVKGQKHLPGNRGLYLIQKGLATHPLFGVDLLVVREAHWRGAAIRSSLSLGSELILMDFSGAP